MLTEVLALTCNLRVPSRVPSSHDRYRKLVYIVKSSFTLAIGLIREKICLGDLGDAEQKSDVEGRGDPYERCCEIPGMISWLYYVRVCSFLRKEK